jgi:hypothetical protein
MGTHVTTVTCFFSTEYIVALGETVNVVISSKGLKLLGSSMKHRHIFLNGTLSHILNLLAKLLLEEQL